MGGDGQMIALDGRGEQLRIDTKNHEAAGKASKLHRHGHGTKIATQLRDCRRRRQRNDGFIPNHLDAQSVG